MKKHLIRQVLEDSIAEEVGIEAGDFLTGIDGNDIEDALDYHLMVSDCEIEVTIEKGDTGEEWVIEIEKEEAEELGLVFESNLMDEYKSCSNRCVFCFIDQLPKGMRETMYFKDDDARLSFLQGNYITMTNMREKDVRRIIQYRLSPINISVHTMNMDLRKEMLGHNKADRIISYMDMLYEAEITMNGQIVLCKGLNDGKELAYSIEQLSRYAPHMQSVSVVPVGLSRHREGLYPLEPFTKEDACEVLDIIHTAQGKCLAEHGSHFIHAGDEFYFLAGREMPKSSTYDGYLQLENGVGMTRLLLDEFDACYNQLDFKETQIKKSLATGMLMEKPMQALVDQLKEKNPNLTVNVVGIRNDFFGERITVSGLLTGQDLLKQLKNQPLYDTLLLPSNLLRSGETILLDDVTIHEIEEALHVKVEVVGSSGSDLIEAILK